MNLIIRAATAEDAGAVGRLAEEFADYLRSLGDTSEFKLNAESYLRDGFGPNPAFSGLVAEQDGQIAGYLLYHFGYDADSATRILYMPDLYVAPKARQQGIGRALMSAAAQICRDAGGTELVWAVFIPNKLAASFYEGMGAKYVEDLNFMWIAADDV
ncbi:MAG: GNAT family N-acetyltransferase [Chloroflexi bacterium]|nr:GNAT family N-acetyltransferase [Chloroflexota bacterium]MCI0578957.1 GNAT family N-acetyltransferase [Chloroflexota bacterium]MCI0645105.1 GNAT family N-acetyltransferase [Chloroflexota bacterium]MCI0731940.1 GNAT family N-acetyltransferase [Chloroflexota bacterium]